MESYLFLKPMFATALWGDGSLVHRYHVERYVPKGMKIEEITGLLAFGGLPKEANEILSGSYKGKTLDTLYEDHPELFGTQEQLRWEHLPVSMGICYACADLSVQVHPTEAYAQRELHCHGKSESWYFVDCPKDADIVMGHNAQTMEELDAYMQRKDWEHLLRRYPIQPGGFYNIQAGTLHAIQQGTTFMEVCNPCPITYRFYDYDRLDRQGQKRELNVAKAKENLLIPYEEHIEDPLFTDYDGVQETLFTDNPNFSVFRYVVKGSGTVPKKKPYLGAFVIDGKGTIDGMPIQAGDSFLITTAITQMHMEGHMTLLAYHG